MTTSHAQDLRPGDVVEYGGCLHHVTHIDRRSGWAFPVAFDGEGWAMALGDGVVLVDRRA